MDKQRWRVASDSDVIKVAFRFKTRTSWFHCECCESLSQHGALLRLFNVFIEASAFPKLLATVFCDPITIMYISVGLLNVFGV